jgi:penicillin amidase
MNKCLLVCSLLIVACGGGDDDPGPPPAGPYDGVELSTDLHIDGLDGPVHIVRDEFGIVHINATTIGDIGFAQGYTMAHDRLPQMDILRRFGAGTLSELFGALEEDVVETDLEMRVHRMKPLAAEALEELRASSDPRDAEIVTMLERFADGVNAYNTALVAGTYELDPSIAVSYDPARFEAWDPVDSLVLGRFQAFSLSYTAPIEVDITDVYQSALEVFDEAVPPGPMDFDQDRFLRRGAATDLVTTRPVGRTSTIDGFPNVDTDTGSRSNGTGTSAAAGPRRPKVPKHLLANAREFFRKKLPMGPHNFMVPRAGSNNWVVGPEHTGGKTLIAGDQHLSLPNPSIFYPTHLVIEGEMDVSGITFPGIPGVILGHNGSVAWSATVVFHDVNDLYLEDIITCAGGSGDCVVFNGEEVAVESWQEEIKIGALGTVTETKTVTYERVPHHGHIIPVVEERDIVPRTDSQALSVKYTGHEVSHEVRATYNLMRAGNVDEAFAALSHFDYGAQNWVIIDNSGNIGWTSNANVPLRAPAAYTWNAESNPWGNAPFWVLPGDGSAEWQGFMDPRYVPHAINPQQGYLVTANSDPVGVTFDGDPLNQDVIDGRPLYASSTYAAGFRTERIDALISGHIDAGTTIGLDELAAIQHDSQSTVGSHMAAHMVAALDTIDDAQNRQQDATDWLMSISSERQQRLREARTYLTNWTLATPTAVDSSPGQGTIDDSVATTLFNVWMHFALEEILGDEMREIGWDIYDINENLSVRTIVTIFAAPSELRSEALPQTNQPVLCDDMDTQGVYESCDRIVMQALDAAITWLETAEAMGTATMSDWRWGKFHTLTMKPLFPEDALNVPPTTDPDPTIRAGYPTPGDNFVVNRADCGWRDREFTQNDDGPAQRFLAEVENGGTIRAKMALPGGTIYNRDSEHYRDLIDEYYVPHRHFDVPYATSEIVAAGEERWVMRSE